MSDMQWRKPNGSTGTYSGPTVNLGRAIPRAMGDYGIRRALHDLAFGYVSGFPVWDIIVFSVRSLFPRPTLDAEITEADEGEFDGYVGTVHLLCPVCDALMPATVTAVVGTPEGAHDGESTLICTPDMTDVWAHMWTHAEQ